MHSLTSNGKAVTDLGLLGWVGRTQQFAFVGDYGECLGQQEACRMLYALELVETQLCGNDTRIVWHILKWFSVTALTGKVQAGRSSSQPCAPKGLHKSTACVHFCALISRTRQSEVAHVYEHNWTQPAAEQGRCVPPLVCLLLLDILALLLLLLPPRKALVTWGSSKLHSCTARS